MRGIRVCAMVSFATVVKFFKKNKFLMTVTPCVVVWGAGSHLID